MRNKIIFAVFAVALIGSTISAELVVNTSDDAASKQNKAIDEKCFIDGSFVPRCSSGKSYEPVSWPVYTADTPQEVWDESNRRAAGFGDVVIPFALPEKPSVMYVPINVPEKYPDVTCFEFIKDGKKTGQTCFDTMEITER